MQLSILCYRYCRSLIFEKTPLSQALLVDYYISEHTPSHNKLNLLGF